MLETSGGSPTLARMAICCSCCAKVSVTTPPSATTLASTTCTNLPAFCSSSRRLPLRRERERFAIVIVILTRRKRALHPPIYRKAPSHMRPFLRWSGTRLGLQSVPATMAASRFTMTGRQRMPRKLLLWRIGNDARLLWSARKLRRRSLSTRPTPRSSRPRVSPRPRTANGQAMR